MKSIKRISYEDWEDIYEPIKENQGLKDYHPDIVNPDEMEEVRQAIEEKRAWTLLDGDGEMFIASGLHFINRMDVYITKKPFEEEIEVKY